MAGLGVLIVLGTALVVGVVIHRIYARSPAASNGMAAAVTALPPGTHILGIAAAGGDVAIWTSGDAVYVYDPASGVLRLAVGVGK